MIVSKLLKYKHISIVYITALMLVANSCIVVKLPDQNPEIDSPRKISLSPQSKIELQEIPVRSMSGDMIAFFPKDWINIDMGESAPSGHVASASNNEYSLIVTLSELKSADFSISYESEGLLGVAKRRFDQRKTKAGGNLDMIGNYEDKSFGINNFISFRTSNTGGAVVAYSSVFRSTMNKFYELSVLPTDIIGNPIPSKEEIEKIYTSILSGVRF